MNGMVSMMNSINSKPAPTNKPKNNNVETGERNDDFVSSLERNIDKTSNKSPDKSPDKSSNKSSDKIDQDKVKLDEQDIKKLETIIKKDPKELSQEDIEGAIAALTNIIEELSKLKLSADGTKGKGDKLILNQSLQGLLKGLKNFKSELTKIDLKKAKFFAQDELKELLTNLKGKLVNSGDSEKQRVIHHRAINQGNIARLSRDNQNKVERNIDIKGKDLGDKLGVSDQQSVSDQATAKGEQIFTEKSKDTVINTEQQGSKEVDFGSVKNFNINNSQNLDTTNYNKVTVTNKEVTFKNIMNQITDKVDVLSTNKGKDITIELRPETLGRLHLKVTIKDGVVSTKILAENGQVKELLESNLGRLRGSLGQKNLQIENFDVSTGHSGEDLTQGFNQNGQFAFSQGDKKQGGNRFSLDIADLDEDFIVEESKEGAEVIGDDDVDYVV